MLEEMDEGIANVGNVGDVGDVASMLSVQSECLDNDEFGDKNNSKKSGEEKIKSDIKVVLGEAVENQVKVMEDCDIENEGDNEGGDIVIATELNEICVRSNESSVTPMGQNLETVGGEYKNHNIGDDEFIIE